MDQIKIGKFLSELRKEKGLTQEQLAEKFNADEWTGLFRESGAQYMIPVAEHHDGFQMYGSELSHWNAVEMGPHRNILKELSDSAQKKNIVTGCSNHRVEHWFFMGHGRTFVDSDFGTWGAEKKMADPCLYTDDDGLWTLLWIPNKRYNQYAICTSPDLIHWKPQDYPELTPEVEQALEQRPTALQVNWSLIERLKEHFEWLDARDVKYLDAVANDPSIVQFGYAPNNDDFKLWLLERGHKLLANTGASRPLWEVK